MRQWAAAAGISRIHIHHHAKSASAALADRMVEVFAVAELAALLGGKGGAN